MKIKRKIFERCTEGILFICGNVTSLVILMIIAFLFKEGSAFFTKSSIEDEYVIVTNKNNLITHLSSHDIKEIFNEDIHNWKELGGENEDVVLFRLNDISNYFSEEEIGENFEHLPGCIEQIVEQHKGMIAFFPKTYLKDNFAGNVLLFDNIALSDFFLGKEWMPTATPAAQFGIFPLIMGTLWVSVGAILLALPLGLGVAIFLSEIASKRLRNFMKPVIELLAGIPSVVYGFFGLVVLVPFIQKIFNIPIGETGLAGAVILAIMALPTIITIAEDAIRNTPKAMKEASFALGATHWQTIWKVIIPYASSGITAAAILGIGRAIGETMAVLMVTGNAALVPHSLLEPLRTIPATIAAELGEAPKGGMHYEALFLLGVILFVITLIINLTVEFIRKRKHA